MASEISMAAYIMGKKYYIDKQIPHIYFKKFFREIEN